MKSRSEKAEAKFMEGFNCAQSVLFAFCEEFGLDADAALKLACGFGGGMARMGNVCGAVTGGIMALGLKFGRGGMDELDKTHIFYSKIHEFRDRFSARHGSCLCRDLLNGCNLATQDGQDYYKENKCFNLICRPCVRDAAALAEDMMAS